MPEIMQRAVRRASVALTCALLGASCAGGSRPATVAPVADPEAEARGLREATRLTEPIRIWFGWQANESGQRVRGAGVARVEPPYKARLDLFREMETVSRAILLDGVLTLPPGAEREILPPPDMMWATLGVFAPSDGTVLVGADRLDDGGTRLRYAYPDGRELHFEASEDRLRLLELVERGRVVERVEVDQAEDRRYPTEATYRNLRDFRELRIARDSIRVEQPFDPGIWQPRGW